MNVSAKGLMPGHVMRWRRQMDRFIVDAGVGDLRPPDRWAASFVAERCRPVDRRIAEHEAAASVR